MSAIVLAERQPGATADAKLNNCIAALPANGGTCDARGFGATTQTIAATVNVGSNRGSGKSVTLLLDRTTKFTCTITNNTPCMVRNAGSTIQAEGTISIPNGGIVLSPSASVSDGLLTIDDIGRNFVGGDVEGLTVLGGSGASLSDALCGVQNALQITHFKNLACGASGLSNAVILKVYCTSGNGCGNIIKLAQPRGTILDGVDIRGVDNQTGWINTLNNTVNGALYSWSGGFARLNYAYGYSARQENAGANVPIVASLTTTAASFDTVKLSGMTSAGHCTLTATNAGAAANVATTYISAKAADRVSVSHAPVARMTYDLACTPN